MEYQIYAAGLMYGFSVMTDPWIPDPTGGRVRVSIKSSNIKWMEFNAEDAYSNVAKVAFCPKIPQPGQWYEYYIDLADPESVQDTGHLEKGSGNPTIGKLQNVFFTFSSGGVAVVDNIYVEY